MPEVDTSYMTTTQSTPAPYITADTHTGRWTRLGSGTNKVSAWTAAELATFAHEGVVWESAGHVNGRELFCRTRYVAAADGALHCYDSTGRKIIVHPADRSLRILVTA